MPSFNEYKQTSESLIHIVMRFNLKSIIPEHIAELIPYASARDELEGEGSVFLDANELPQPFPDMPTGVNRYPGEQPIRLKKKLSAVKGVKPDSIFLGNGSDEIIDMLMRCFSRPGKDQIMVFPPTFGMYGVRARVNNLEVIAHNLDRDFSLNAREALSKAGPETRLLFVCHPNNPTGNMQKMETIRELIANFNGIVVVDEAYIDFCADKSVLPLLKEYPNLVVLQTFSKAYGMAGARVGVAYAATDIIRVLEKVSFPYNLGIPAIRLAEKALDSHAMYRLNVESIRASRDQLANIIPSLPLAMKVYPSVANFLLVKVSDADALYRHLARSGVIVRNRSKEPGCEGCLRITTGTTEENQLLVAAWKAFGSAKVLQAGGAGPGMAPAQQNKQGMPESSPGKGKLREATIQRSTAETNVAVRIRLDGRGYANISTGIPFYDHMLEQIARHGMMDLEVDARGDLEVDSHHTLEDTAISIGMAFRQALGDKKGIDRYGFELPMDDSRAKVLIDLGGRSFLKWDVSFTVPEIGNVPATLFQHFFRSFADATASNLHVEATGEDDHHKVEAVFKAFARALKMAVARNHSDTMPSTKGML